MMELDDLVFNKTGQIKSNNLTFFTFHVSRFTFNVY